MYVICIENGHCLKYLVQHLLLEKQRKDSHKINEKYFKINFVEAYFHLYEKKGQKAFSNYLIFFREFIVIL